MRRYKFKDILEELRREITVAIDRKYSGVILKADGEIVHDYIILRAKDAAVPATLAFYAQKCAALGSNMEHIEGVHALIKRVERFQLKFADRVKVPDTKEEDLIFDASEEL